MEKHNIIIKEGNNQMGLSIPSLKLKGWPMGNGEFKITAGGIKSILTIILIIGVLIGVVKGYTILGETSKLNSQVLVEIKPQVQKNDKRLIKVETELCAIRKSQDRMLIKQDRQDEKLDKILEKIR